MCHGVNVSGTPVEDSRIVMPPALIKNMSVRGIGRRFESFHLAEHRMLLSKMTPVQSNFFQMSLRQVLLQCTYWRIFFIYICYSDACQQHFKKSVKKLSYTLWTECTFMSTLFWIIYWMILQLGCHLFPHWYDIHKYVNKVKGKDI